jgi:ureidoacrylate peracid hydrolase
MDVKQHVEVIRMEINPKNTALIVVDVQNGYCSDNGSFKSYGFDIKPMQEMVPKLKEFISAYKEKGGLVIYTQEIEGEKSPKNMKALYEKGPLEPMCLPGSLDTEFYEVAPQEEDIVLKKHTWSGFSNPELDKILKEKGIENIILTGVCTDVCIDATLTGALERGYNIIVPKDLVATDGRDWRQSLHNIYLNASWPILKAHVYDSKEVLEKLGGD